MRVGFSVRAWMDLEILRISRELSKVFFQARNDLIGCFNNLATYHEAFTGPAELGGMFFTKIPPPGPVAHTDHSQDAVNTHGIDGRRNGFAGPASGNGNNSETFAQ